MSISLFYPVFRDGVSKKWTRIYLPPVDLELSVLAVALCLQPAAGWKGGGEAVFSVRAPHEGTGWGER